MIDLRNTAPMPVDKTLSQIETFLTSLEATQTELASLLEKKRAALTNARADELLRLSHIEADLAVRLQEHLDDRRRIIEQAEQRGSAAESIRHLVTQIGGEAASRLEPRLQHAERLAKTLRRESWIHWIVAQRTCRHYGDLLELIAHCGETAPTYSRSPSRQTTGGAILDASA